jgi:hypothetical protein
MEPDFDAPIPGQSLTTPPKSYPWERPPEIVDPEEALLMHLERLNTSERIEGILDLLEMDIDIQTLTTGIIRSAVAEGVHTIDVGMIIAPMVHEFIKTTAQMAGVPFDEGFEDKKKKEKEAQLRIQAKALHKLRKMQGLPEKAMVKEAAVAAAETQEEAPMEAPMKPAGLMARGM